ncbi:restriction endonuclease subunit S [Methanosarcina mazei]|uniref:Restriction endonuclease n=1 Tax=Methanosarcina mazei TaxID=2209 RepID=A0A6C0VLJ8_METMZ|nr:restriction endonuclease subunit S [Methanosarcina mazei]QIB92349.1 restriction endonuclease [Methanosarcina mazei]WIM44976.1 restriction endonuclease subunit S [Methanosarcina mazei]WIM48420.1 restriction endonuclease subunit S [Methanosarcina mazei]
MGEVCQTTSGGTPSRKNPSFYEGNIPWVKSGELNYNTIFETEEYISEEAIKKSSAKIIPKDTLLVALYGATIGKLAFLGVDAATNQAVCAIFKNGIFESKFLYYLFFHRKQDLIKEAIGGAQPNISQTILKNLEVTICPLPEQRAIVSKIEQLFSELENGIANLKLAKEQLKVYRQAVLKKAFEGELTKKWREQQTDLPDAGGLLEQIRKEKEKAAKKAGKKLKQVKPFTEDELEDLNRLPKEWNWVKIGNLTLGVEYGTSAKSKESGDVAVLRMGNIQNGRFDWSDLVYTSDKTEIEKYLLSKDDVLFNRTNSPELVGKTAIYKGEKPAIFAGYLIRINQLSELAVADYLNYFLNCHIAKVHGNSVKTDGVNQSNINGEKLGNYPFPLCSLPEQQTIVQEIETRLSICDKIEQDIETNLEKAEALRQSILKKAFEGKLLNERELAEVRGAEDWEPAEVLLERIKAEKAQNGKK